MVNGPGGPRRVELAHLATIGKILTAARDPSSLRTKELTHISRKGTTEGLRNTATGLQDIIIQSVKVGELDFTAVASRGAELLQAIEAELTKATAAREEAERELHTASGRITQIEEARAAAVGKLGEIEAQLAKVTGDRAAVNRELLTAQARLQERTDTIQALERTNGEIDQARIAALSHQDELQRLRDEAVVKQGQLQGQVDDLQSKIVDAERIRKEKIDTEKELSRLRSEVGQLRRELGPAREELERVKNDPAIAGIRSRITEIERLLGEREAELSQRRTKITELEGALTESEFGHSQKSGEMAETLRSRTEERDAAKAELKELQKQSELTRQWADYGMRTYNETLPGLAQQLQQLQESEAAMVLAHQHFATQKEEEIALIRSTPRKLPPALTLLAELKDKNPKAYHFAVKMLVHIATQINEEALKAAGSPPSASGGYDQNTLRSPATVQALEIDEFQNRAVFGLDMVSRAIELRETNPSAAHRLSKLYRFLTKPETAPEAKVEMVEFLEKILQDPALIQGFMAQIKEMERIEKMESTDPINVRKGLLLEIKYLASPANNKEYMDRAQILYVNYREELVAFLSDPSIDNPTKGTITKIITDASTAAGEIISFGNGDPEPPPAPELKKAGFFRSLFGKADKDR